MSKKWFIQLYKVTILFAMIFVSSLSYGLTDKQIDLVQNQLNLSQQKKYKDYLSIKSKLKDSNIESYLEYKEIALNPEAFTQENIDKYFDENSGNYWSKALCDDLAIYYAKSKNWKMFKKFYDGDLQTAGKCWNIKKENSGAFREKAIIDFSKYWQTKKYVASECVDIQKYWQGYPNKGRDCVVDKAYSLALENDFENSLLLLNNNAKKDEYVNYIRDWKKVTADPTGLDDFILKYHNNPKFNEIILDISNDSIKTNLTQYAKIWGNLENKKYLDDTIKNQIKLAIAIGFAKTQNMKESKAWFSQVNKQYYTDIAWGWLLRIEIYQLEYKNYIRVYQQLPKKLQEQDVWRYWLAYSYNQTNNKSKANEIYTDLSKIKYNYYALRSADALGEKYSLDSKDVDQISGSKIKELLNDENIYQAVELYKADQYKDATKLWKWTINQKFNNGQRSKIPELAQLAWLNKMHYHAIFSMGMLGKKGHDKLFFPKPYEQMIGEQSQKNDLEDSLILSIMRKESLFDIQSSSYVGAKGLMQVTMPTADFISKKYKLYMQDIDLSSQIYSPKVNIKLGSANLNFLSGLFKGNLVLSIAAYNAGPGNVDKWLPNKAISAKQWIESITFGETRHYIRNVLVNIVIYNNVILSNDKISLSSMLDSKISKQLSFRE